MYWQDIDGQYRGNIHFWKIWLILGLHIDPIFKLSLLQCQPIILGSLYIVIILNSSP